MRVSAKNSYTFHVQAMETAAILAAILEDWPDFALILALLFANATISYWKESKAVRALLAVFSLRLNEDQDDHADTDYMRCMQWDPGYYRCLLLKP